MWYAGLTNVWPDWCSLKLAVRLYRHSQQVRRVLGWSTKMGAGAFKLPLHGLNALTKQWGLLEGMDRFSSTIKSSKGHFQSLERQVSRHAAELEPLSSEVRRLQGVLTQLALTWPLFRPWLSLWSPRATRIAPLMTKKSKSGSILMRYCQDGTKSQRSLFSLTFFPRIVSIWPQLDLSWFFAASFWRLGKSTVAFRSVFTVQVGLNC